MKLSIRNVLLLLVVPNVSGQKDRKLGKAKSKGSKTEPTPRTPGVDDQQGYARVAKMYVGINPKLGEGSGFVIRNITSTDYPGNVGSLSSNKGRNNLCTCDCEAGPDGIGCVGWGGIAFRYNSLLWMDPYDATRWTGQMQAFQMAGDGTELNFIGTDTRLYPGGPAIYNVACTDGDCGGLISGTFRQANSKVSCAAGIADEALDDGTTCFQRCKNVDAYTNWLAYCKAGMEDESLGFVGYNEKNARVNEAGVAVSEYGV